MKVLHSKGADTGADKRVMIAMPAYGNIHPIVVYSLWCSAPILNDSGIDHELFMLSGGCHVDDNRNHIIQAFLESKCTDLVMIDDDTRFSGYDIVRLVEYEKDVVAGIASKKAYPLDFACRIKDESIIDGLIDADGVGAAFLKISRNAAIILSDCSIKYSSKVGSKTVMMPLIFERTVENGARWGGDYSFCNKWKAVGGRIYIDPEIILGHIGDNEWVGSLGQHLRKKNGTSFEFIKSIINKIASGKETARDYIQLVNEWDNEYSASEDLLYAITLIARECGTILECGSGLSTLVLGAVNSNVISIENDPVWHDGISKAVHNLGHKTKLIMSELIDGYYGSIPDISPDLIIVDGPPRYLSDRSKIVNHVNPANGCIWVVDDCDNNILGKITSKFDVKFTTFGRYAIGR